MSLQEALTALGIRPIADAEELVTAGDAIDEIMTASFPCLSDGRITPLPAEIGLLYDAHEVMREWLARAQHELAQHGIGVLEVGKPPIVKQDVLRQPWADEPPKIVQVETKCDHRFVWIDEQRASIQCRTCKVDVNAVWWLARYTKDLAKSADWKRHLDKERSKLHEEIATLKEERNKHRSAINRRNKKAKS